MVRPTLYFVRHGQTDWNAAQRLQGQTDIPLNETGRGQARRNGELLRARLGAAHHLDFVASPLGRARETMEIVRGALGLEAGTYRTDERLKEIDFGAWEGETWIGMHPSPDATMRAWLDDRWATAPPNGESYEALSARVVAWLEEVTRDTLVVAHGGVMRVLRGHVGGLDTAAIATLDVPQDKVLVINGAGESWL
jgi:probable phosphoglycerate mutase